MLREAEVKMSLECKKYHALGAQERDHYWQGEMGTLKESAEEALTKTKDAAREKLKCILEKQTSQLDEARMQAEKDKEHIIKDVMRSVETSSNDLLQQKETELGYIFEKQREEYIKKANVDIENAVSQAVKSEK